jgi:hypothetical protein
MVVPAQTIVIEDRLSHENDLNCLDFANCDPSHEFDPESNSVYMKITDEEHAARCKE